MSKVSQAYFLPEGVTTPLLSLPDGRTISVPREEFFVGSQNREGESVVLKEEVEDSVMVDGNRMRRRSIEEMKVDESSVSLLRKDDLPDIEVAQPPQPPAPKPAPAAKKPEKPRTWGQWAYSWWQWYTMYRQLFTYIMVTNIIVLFLAAFGKLPFAREYAPQIAVANQLLCVLVRNECFMRVLYYILVKSVTIFTPNGLGTLWAPVCVRNTITNFLLHIGGIHSGCGFGTVMWLVYVLVRIVVNNELYNMAITILGAILLFIVVLACVTAIPNLRFYLHNHFEHGHRYSGWSSIAILWAFIILNDTYDPNGKRYDVRGGHFYTHFQFFAAIFTTFLVVLPWLCVREVPVECEVSPLKRITLIKFPGYVQPGLYGRISRKSLSEWHVFGCFSEHYTKDYHFMICSVVGGFTKGLANDPPKTLYVRTVKFAGYSYCHRMYEKGIAICTGAAIGVFISLFSQGLTNFDLIWVGSNFEATYGKTVIDLLKKGCPGDRLTLYDTKVMPRPNLTDLAAAQYHEKKAQVVFCVSNLEGTRGIVNGCRARGIPAFGPIWDA